MTRIDELLSAMTPEEKAGQLTQYFYFAQPAGEPHHVEAALGRGGAGSLLFVTDPVEINRLQRLAVEGHRLGIPLMFALDVIHGMRTVFPVPIAMAASWDPELIERGQAVAAREARAAGAHWTFAPMVDVARDPRWGRMVEGAGEDPFLGAVVAAAQVRGFQNNAVRGEGVIAGPKHFAGYGASVGGRDYDEVSLSDHELWNVYFPPFRAAIEAGAGNVMTAYMPLNGVPASGNDWLLTDVLRGEWGFDGFVVSDANAVRNLVVQGFAADPADAAARGVTAGVDMEMTFDDPAYARLPEALASGAVSEKLIDERVRRVLEMKERLGLFDNPYVDEDRARQVLADSDHRRAAREAAQRTAVLLRNEGDLLPLDPARLSSIAVLGPLADSVRDTLGPWVLDAVDRGETVTVLDGIRTATDGSQTSTATDGQTDTAGDSQTNTATDGQTSPTTDGQTSPTTEDQTSPTTDRQTSPTTDRHTGTATGSQTSTAGDSQTDTAGGGRIRIDYAPGIPFPRRDIPWIFDREGKNEPADPEGFDPEAEFARAVAMARGADVAIVVAGEGATMIGEGASRSSLDLPGRQLELLQAVVATGTPTVLLVLNGRPLDLRWAAANVPAILDIWYPGTQGGNAVADLLFGAVSPAGKLPFTWPRTAGQVPAYYSHIRSHDPDHQAERYWDEESTPLFPFGFGLSYGRFEYAGLTVSPSGTVTVDVTNTGTREAAEVVQLYLHQRHGRAARPVRELKGFQRVVLRPGETRRVTFTVGEAERRYWSAATRDWVVDDTTYDVFVGGDSTATLTASYTPEKGL